MKVSRPGRRNPGRSVAGALTRRDDGRMSNTAFPIISVVDLDPTVRFYGQLGFCPTYRLPPDGDPAFVMLERDGAGLGIAAGDPIEERSSYYVDDVDAAFAQLATAGAPVVGEPFDRPWGERVAEVRGPTGNLVHLGAAARATTPGAGRG